MCNRLRTLRIGRYALYATYANGYTSIFKFSWGRTPKPPPFATPPPSFFLQKRLHITKPLGTPLGGLLHIQLVLTGLQFLRSLDLQICNLVLLLLTGVNCR